MAGTTRLLDLDQHRITVTVERDRSDLLEVPGSLAFDPVLLPAARPVCAAAGGERAMQRLIVHPPQHQHFTGVVLLCDGREQAGRVALQPRRDPRIECAALLGHGCDSLSSARMAAASLTGYPAARSACFTVAIRSSPKWNRLAASTASAPDRMAGAKSLAWPAPPLAIIGTSTAARTASISDRSKPALVPSASIELSRISPAPSSAAVAAQRTASIPVPRRPPWVVTSKVSRWPSTRRPSTETTTACEPNLAAAAVSTAGLAIAAVFNETLSAPARSSLSTSSGPRTPPPTVSGMNTWSAVRVTTSHIVSRSSLDAVMSRNTSSSAPSAS